VREAEVSPLLEVIVREQLVKTQQAEEGLAAYMVICSVEIGDSIVITYSSK
jgi:hypothetical protein